MDELVIAWILSAIIAIWTVMFVIVKIYASVNVNNIRL